MPRPRNPLVEQFTKAGFSRRHAFRLAQVVGSPVAWQLYRDGRLSVADAARLAKDYPQHGEQCLLAFHVLNGWRMRDAEDAYREAVDAVAAEVLAVNPNVSDNDLHQIIDDRVAGPVRRMECLPRIAPIGTIAGWFGGLLRPDPLAEAVAEIGGSAPSSTTSAQTQTHKTKQEADDARAQQPGLATNQ